VVDDYLDNVHISIGDNPEERGLAGSAIREAKPFISNDREADTSVLVSPRREEALKRGCRSTAAFPMSLGGQVVGAFNLHASETDFFNEDMIRLLEEVAADISFHSPWRR
jgi:GAF domain-containing protein